MALNRIGLLTYPLQAVFQYQPGRDLLGSSNAFNTVDQLRINTEADIAQNVSGQNALLITDTLRNLKFTPPEPQDPLLPNTTPYTILPLAEFDNLNLIRQNPLLDVGSQQALNLVSVGEDQERSVVPKPVERGAVQSLTSEPRTSGSLPAPAETQPAALVVGGSFQNSENLTNSANTVGGSQPVGLSTSSQTPSDLQLGVDFPASQALNPASLPFLLHPSRTPYALAAYEVREQVVIPGEPEPVSQQVQPISPVAGVQSIDGPKVQVAQERGRETPRRQTQPSASSSVKSIKYMLKKANEDLIARGSPLHLVLAQNETGFQLDVYDCSFPGLCSLTHDVSLELENLTTILANLANETGLIVDSKL
nr:hypothetical protein [Desulfobulbaceae bacterium]